MRLLTSLLVALALVAVGCGDDDEGGAAGPSTTTSEPPATSEATTTSQDDDGGDGVTLSETCAGSEGYTIGFPADWDAVAECGQFGPAPLEEPEAGTDERPGVVSVYVDEVEFDHVAESESEGATERTEATVDGRPAVRIAGEVGDRSLYPEGTRRVIWLVDLTAGSDTDSSTLFLTAVDVRDDVDFDHAVDVLDEMARTITITA